MDKSALCDRNDRKREYITQSQLSRRHPAPHDLNQDDSTPYERYGLHTLTGDPNQLYYLAVE
jgi:hypothetical protein